MSINTFLIQTNIFLIWFQEIHLEFENTHFLIWTNTFKNFEQILFSMWTNTFIKLNKYIAYSTQIRRELPLWARRGLRSPVHGGSEFLFLLLLARCWWWLARCPQFPGCCLHCWSTGQSSLIQLQQPSHMTYACYPNLDSEIIIRNTDTGSPRPLVTSSWEYSDKARTVTRVMAVPKMHSVMVTVMVFYAVDPSIATVFANANPLARSQCATRQALSSYQLSSQSISCFWCNVPSPKSVNMILSRKGHACTNSISIIIISLSKYYQLISVQWPT